MADRAEIRAKIEQAITDVIDEDHYCIAHSEGQACCIDPRVPPDQFGYGGEAVRAGLIDRLVEIAMGTGLAARDA